MNRRRFYYGQLVTQGELNDTFDQAELAEQQAFTDNDHVGVVDGLVVSENTVPDLNIKITTGLARDSNGQRVANQALAVLSLAEDSNNVSTDVLVAGNEKWVTVFAVYDVVLSDLRQTLDNNNVYWREDEGIAWVVVQGSEALIGTATRPALIPGYVLVADVRREFGVATITNADIDPDPTVSPVPPATRKQFPFTITSSAPVQFVTGKPQEAVQGVLTAFNQHAAGSANKHEAGDITFNPVGTNFSISDTDVYAALNNTMTTVAPYPGNLSTSPDRYLTHGLNSDWRDSSYRQLFTFAEQIAVPAGGGDCDMKIAGIDPSDGDNGFIELENNGIYNIYLTATSVTNAAAGDANYSYRSLLYIGPIQRNGPATSLLVPVTDTNTGNNANLTMSLFLSAGNILYVRATAAVALDGYDLRLAATVEIQRTTHP